MNKTTTTCENIMNNADYLEPCKEIETIEMEIPDCNLMCDGKLI